MNVVSLRARSCMGFFANPLHYYQPSESQKVKSRYAKLPKKVVQKSPFPQVITGDRGIGDKKIVLRFTSWHNSYLTFIWGLNISCLLYIVCYSRNAMGRMQRTFTFVFHIFPASHRGIFLITRTASLSRAS